MELVKYTVGDIKRIIAESAQEFDAKLGPSVKSDNKKNNEKSYKDTEKKVKDYDGGLQPDKKGDLPEKADYNRTTLDYNPRTAPSKEFKDKVNAQLKGFTSKLEEENKIEKADVYDRDGKIGKQLKDASDKINDEKEALGTSGIQGHNLKTDGKTEKKETMYENKKPAAKRLVFKHTKFLNESQMLSRIPEEYKRDGQVIYMKDANDNEYMVECSKSTNTGLIEVDVVSYKNDKLMSEQLNRINELMDYETPATYAPSSMQTRIDESKKFGDIMNLSRELNK